MFNYLEEISKKLSTAVEFAIEQSNQFEDSGGIEALMKALSNIKMTPELLAKIEQVRNSKHLIPAIPSSEPLSKVVDVDVTKALEVVGVDGSQIYPAESPVMWAYTRAVAVSNGEQKEFGQFFEPKELIDETGHPFGNAHIDSWREVLEMEALVEAAKLWPQKIVLSDGSLIPWAGIKKEMNQQSDSYKSKKRMATGKMIAGVISSPKSKYITNLLNIVMGNSQADSKRGLIGDKELFKRTLKVGQRSAMYIHGSPLNDITANDAVFLFYLKISEEEIVRVEIPAWIANSPGAVDIVHASIVQDSRGLDYPFHLFQAHDQCKIPASVAQAIQNEAITQYVAKTGHYPYQAAKERLKNA